MQTARCPRCNKTTVLDKENPFRPFCSERCAVLDLSAWADEQYKVPIAVQETESVNQNEDDED